MLRSKLPLLYVFTSYTLLSVGRRACTTLHRGVVWLPDYNRHFTSYVTHVGYRTKTIIWTWGLRKCVCFDYGRGDQCVSLCGRFCTQSICPIEPMTRHTRNERSQDISHWGSEWSSRLCGANAKNRSDSTVSRERELKVTTAAAIDESWPTCIFFLGCNSCAEWNLFARYLSNDLHCVFLDNNTLC
jgi:hypothetical protein